jgi:hypothetical protein
MTQDVPAIDQISFETPARKDSGHSQDKKENVGESQDDEQDVELGESQEKHDAQSFKYEILECEYSSCCLNT